MLDVATLTLLGWCVVGLLVLYWKSRGR